MKPIRYAEAWMDQSDLIALMESLLRSFRTGWYGFGEKCIEFEKAFAKYLGSNHASFVNSGSSANLLAIGALTTSGKITRGSEVVTTACSFPTTLNPALLYGLKPVFVDIDLPSWSVNIEALRTAVESGAKLVMLPHLNGIPHDMEEVGRITKANSVEVVEDACDALGSRFMGRPVGTFGELGTFSFYVAHHMTTGEGGMVVTNNERLGETVTSLRDWGRASKISIGETLEKRSLSYQKITRDLPEDYEQRYTYTSIGFNLKPLEMQGAWGLSQLQKLEGIVKRRRKNYERLSGWLRSYKDHLILPEPGPKADVSWFWLPIVVRENAPFKRKDIVTFLEQEGIETRPILAGDLLKQPAYRNIDHRVVGPLTNSETVMRGGFIVGLHPGLSDEDMAYMRTRFQSFFEGLAR